MQYYKYTTFGLAAALVVVTFSQWQEPDPAPIDVIAPVATAIPEWWAMTFYNYTHDRMWETQLEYEYRHSPKDCTLQASKQETEDSEMLVLLELDCVRMYSEGVGPSTFTNGTIIEPMEDDFVVAWTDLDDCHLSIRHNVYSEASRNSTSAMIHC